MADQRALTLTPGAQWQNRKAGLFLFWPLLADLRFNRMVQAAGYPASEMISAESAILSLLMLKLLDKERQSHMNDVV